MSRYMMDMELRLPEDEVQEIIHSFLESGGFYPGQWQGKPCYVSDYGLNGPGYSGSINKNLEQIYFFDYTYLEGRLHFEAWVRDGKKNENGLTGAYNFAMKQPYTALVSRLQKNLTERLPSGSELRLKAEAQNELLQKSGDKMNTGKQILGVVGFIMLFIALMNVLRHLGIFY